MVELTGREGGEITATCNEFSSTTAGNTTKVYVDTSQLLLSKFLLAGTACILCWKKNTDRTFPSLSVLFCASFLLQEYLLFWHELASRARRHLTAFCQWHRAHPSHLVPILWNDSLLETDHECSISSLSATLDGNIRIFCCVRFWHLLNSMVRNDWHHKILLRAEVRDVIYAEEEKCAVWEISNTNNSDHLELWSQRSMFTVWVCADLVTWQHGYQNPLR